jgi:integrase
VPGRTLSDYESVRCSDTPSTGTAKTPPKRGLAPLRIHDLRHSAVSLWISEGASPKQVAAMAGHTSVSVVLDRYGHRYPQHEEALMQRFEARTSQSRTASTRGS